VCVCVCVCALLRPFRPEQDLGPVVLFMMGVSVLASESWVYYHGHTTTVRFTDVSLQASHTAAGQYFIIMHRVLHSVARTQSLLVRLYFLL